jgi:2-iminobutanoate/2-iminopropanoate deaminase
MPTDPLAPDPLAPDPLAQEPRHSSTAVVTAEAAARFAKQLLSHVGRKASVQPLEGVPDGGRLVFAYGVGTVRPENGRLVLHAAASDPESLARVEDVLGRHLVRFGARQQLSVSWERAPARETGERPGPPGPASGGAGGIETLHTDRAPAHSGPVPQAVSAGGWIHVSALFGTDPTSGALPEDAHAEAAQLFDNLEAVLAAGGATLSDVVRAGVFMRDLQRDRPAFNEVWVRRFGDHRPARSAVQSDAFGRAGENPRYLVEVTAYRG